MEADEQKRFAKIEQYLDGSLSEKEVQDFEEKVKQDQALAKEVLLQKEVESLLKHGEEDELEESLEKLGKHHTQSSGE